MLRTFGVCPTPKSPLSTRCPDHGRWQVRLLDSSLMFQLREGSLAGDFFRKFCRGKNMKQKRWKWLKGEFLIWFSGDPIGIRESQLETSTSIGVQVFLKPVLAEIWHPNTFIKRGTLDDVQDYVAKDSKDLDFSRTDLSEEWCWSHGNRVTPFKNRVILGEIQPFT